MINAVPGLELRQVRHAYGSKKVLDGVDLEIEEGSLTCLLGSSGCGKTTVLRLAAGLENLQEGFIKINGLLVGSNKVSRPTEDRDVGLMFQEHALFPHLTVLENVLFGIEDIEVASRTDSASRALERVDMLKSINVYPHMLSGGEQQRVALARALAARPRIMLLDEPFSELDSDLRASIRSDTREILRDLGLTTLMVTHDPTEAMMMGDDLALMNEGRIVQTGCPSDIYRKPVDPFCARSLGDVIEYEGTIERGRVRTPLGFVPTDLGADVEKTVVLVRPEALHFQAANEDTGIRIKFIKIKDLGPISDVQCQVMDNGVKFRVNVPTRDLRGIGNIVSIDLDFSMVFVFPVR